MENDIFDISNLDVSSFNEEKATDNTFFKLSTDEKGNGSAIVRFLPDPNNITAQLMYQINVNTERNGEKRWFAAWSPQTIGKPDPFQEEWARLYSINNVDSIEAVTVGMPYSTADSNKQQKDSARIWKLQIIVERRIHYVIKTNSLLAYYQIC